MKVQSTRQEIRTKALGVKTFKYPNGSSGTSVKSASAWVTFFGP